MNLFDRDMERLTSTTLGLAALVEEMIHWATRSIRDGRDDLAEQVVAGEATIDRIEVEIEEECHRFLALHDPVAGDLRRVTAVLKVNHELERMADLAAGIARRAMAMTSECPSVSIPDGMDAMAILVVEMVGESLDALIAVDSDSARDVIAMDKEVDRLCQEVVDELKRMMKADEDRIDAGVHLLLAAARLERIADHATNIAEEAVFMREGVIIRHQAPASAVSGRQ